MQASEGDGTVLAAKFGIQVSARARGAPTMQECLERSTGTRSKSLTLPGLTGIQPFTSWPRSGQLSEPNRE